jgi:hypothetical protein
MPALRNEDALPEQNGRRKDVQILRKRHCAVQAFLLADPVFKEHWGDAHRRETEQTIDFHAGTLRKVGDRKENVAFGSWD